MDESGRLIENFNSGRTFNAQNINLDLYRLFSNDRKYNSSLSSDLKQALSINDNAIVFLNGENPVYNQKIFKDVVGGESFSDLEFHYFDLTEILLNNMGNKVMFAEDQDLFKDFGENVYYGAWGLYKDFQNIGTTSNNKNDSNLPIEVQRVLNDKKGLLSIVSYYVILNILKSFGNEKKKVFYFDEYRLGNTLSYADIQNIFGIVYKFFEKYFPDYDLLKNCMFVISQS